jgi:uncharacterized protein YaiI (UPF0178 family)
MALLEFDVETGRKHMNLQALRALGAITPGRFRGGVQSERAFAKRDIDMMTRSLTKQMGRGRVQTGPGAVQSPQVRQASAQQMMISSKTLTAQEMTAQNTGMTADYMLAVKILGQTTKVFTERSFRVGKNTLNEDYGWRKEVRERWKKLDQRYKGDKRKDADKERVWRNKLSKWWHQSTSTMKDFYHSFKKMRFFQMISTIARSLAGVAGAGVGVLGSVFKGLVKQNRLLSSAIRDNTKVARQTLKSRILRLKESVGIKSQQELFPKATLRERAKKFREVSFRERMYQAEIGIGKKYRKTSESIRARIANKLEERAARRAQMFLPGMGPPTSGQRAVVGVKAANANVWGLQKKALSAAGTKLGAAQAAAGGGALGAVKLGGKAAMATGKAIARWAPGLGLLIGAGEAIGRAKEGDILGAMTAGIGGVASVIPGVGPMIGLAIDAAASLIPDSVRNWFNKMAGKLFEKLFGVPIAKAGEFFKKMLGPTLSGALSWVAESLMDITENISKVFTDVWKILRRTILHPNVLKALGVIAALLGGVILYSIKLVAKAISSITGFLVAVVDLLTFKGGFNLKSIGKNIWNLFTSFAKMLLHATFYGLIVKLFAGIFDVLTGWLPNWAKKALGIKPKGTKTKATSEMATQSAESTSDSLGFLKGTTAAVANKAQKAAIVGSNALGKATDEIVRYGDKAKEAVVHPPRGGYMEWWLGKVNYNKLTRQMGLEGKDKKDEGSTPKPDGGRRYEDKWQKAEQSLMLGGAKDTGVGLWGITKGLGKMLGGVGIGIGRAFRDALGFSPGGVYDQVSAAKREGRGIYSLGGRRKAAAAGSPDVGAVSPLPPPGFVAHDILPGVYVDYQRQRYWKSGVTYNTISKVMGSAPGISTPRPGSFSRTWRAVKNYLSLVGSNMGQGAQEIGKPFATAGKFYGEMGASTLSAIANVPGALAAMPAEFVRTGEAAPMPQMRYSKNLKRAKIQKRYEHLSTRVVDELEKTAEKDIETGQKLSAERANFFKSVKNFFHSRKREYADKKYQQRFIDPETGAFRNLKKEIPSARGMMIDRLRGYKGGYRMPVARMTRKEKADQAQYQLEEIKYQKNWEKFRTNFITVLEENEKRQAQAERLKKLPSFLTPHEYFRGKMKGMGRDYLPSESQLTMKQLMEKNRRRKQGIANLTQLSQWTGQKTTPPERPMKDEKSAPSFMKNVVGKTAKDLGLMVVGQVPSAWTTSKKAGAGFTFSTADLGALAASYESSGDMSQINPNDSNGYPSFGLYQINGTNMGNFIEFLKNNGYSRISNYLDANLRSGGVKGQPLKEAWISLSQQYPTQFAEAQRNYIHDKMYTPGLTSFSRITGITDTSTLPLSLKQAIWSTSVQHGGYKKVFKIMKDMLKGSKDPQDIIGALYAARAQYYPASAERYRKEGRQALANLEYELGMADVGLSPTMGTGAGALGAASTATASLAGNVSGVGATATQIGGSLLGKMGDVAGLGGEVGAQMTALFPGGGAGVMDTIAQSSTAIMGQLAGEIRSMGSQLSGPLASKFTEMTGGNNELMQMLRSIANQSSKADAQQQGRKAPDVIGVAQPE